MTKRATRGTTVWQLERAVGNGVFYTAGIYAGLHSAAAQAAPIHNWTKRHPDKYELTDPTRGTTWRLTRMTVA